MYGGGGALAGNDAGYFATVLMVLLWALRPLGDALTEVLATCCSNAMCRTRCTSASEEMVFRVYEFVSMWSPPTWRRKEFLCDGHTKAVAGSLNIVVRYSCQHFPTAVYCRVLSS
jgi:hypothetical protein